MKVYQLLLSTILTLASTSPVLAGNQCLELFRQDHRSEKTIPQNKNKSALGISTAERLLVILDNMPEATRHKLFDALRSLDSRKVTQILSEGKLPKDLLQGLDAKDIAPLEQALVDFFHFSEAFPALLSLKNSEQWTLRILKSLHEQEQRPKHSNAAILESQAQAPRLRRTINNSLINLIQQATADYQGMKFGKTGFQLVWHKIKRFFFPLHNRVEEQVSVGHFYQKQLERLRVVDSIVIRELLSEKEAALLTDAELNRATEIVLDSPAEIALIEKSLRAIFGPTFKNGSEVEIGKFDIYKGSKKIDETDFTAVQDGFDSKNIDSLDQLHEIMNVLRQRLGQNPRTLKEKTLDEIRIYHEAQYRRLSRWYSQYREITDRDSNEWYTVEDRHTRQVEVGKDKDGNPIYEDEVYYMDRTVTPTFEDILSKSYDRGDRDVKGLSSIESKTETMVQRESAPRELLSIAEDFIGQFVKQNITSFSQVKPREKNESEIKKLISTIEKMLPSQREYSQWSDSQIRRQYSDDNVSNFRDRNTWVVRRLENAVKELLVLQEFMRRNQPQMTLAFDEMDFTLWLESLRSYRNWNYFYKSALFTTATTTGTSAWMYHTDPQFAHWLSTNAPMIVDFFQYFTGTK